MAEPLSEQRKNLARLRGRGSVELVVDGGVDLSAECIRLDALIDGEQAAKLIAFTWIIGLESHGRILPVVISGEQSFEDRNPEHVHIPVGTKPHQDGGKKGLRVAGAGENGAHPVAGEIGRHVLALAEHGGLGKILPHRRLTVAWRRLDAHVGEEALVVSRDGAEVVLEIEADGEARGVGGEAQHMKADAFRQFRGD